METPTPDEPMSKLMRFWTSRRMVVIAIVALSGIALHLVIRYGMHSEVPSYQIPLWIVLAFGGIPLVYELLKKVAKFEFGSDLLAGIPDTVKIYQVLDNCHAAHHVSLALKALGIAEEDRMSLCRQLRTRLRSGEWRSVVQELQQLVDANPEIETLATELNYLRKHGESGRLAYPFFRGQGIPLGSGEIESSIRRVINLRLKGNGIFWREENAESMLQLRALVISDRWDERMLTMRQYRKTSHLPDWKWTPLPMTTKSEPKLKSTQNTA